MTHTQLTPTEPSLPVAPRVPAPTRSTRRFSEAWLAYLFLLPAFLIIALFGLFPIGYSFYMSLYNWRIRRSGFVGLDNYHELVGDLKGPLMFVGGLLLVLVAHWLWTSFTQTSPFTTPEGMDGGLRRRANWLKVPAALLVLAAGVSVIFGWHSMSATGDHDFMTSLLITVWYAILSIPAQIALALVLASILFQKIKGVTFFRAVYFLPYVMPVVATAAVFRSIFSPRETSLANTVLSWVHLPPQQWVFDPRPLPEVLFGLHLPGVWPSMALATIALFGIWSFVGYNVVIFLAGLTNISRDLYEAAEIDGASSWAQFRHITVPLLSPVIFYVALVGLIGSLHAFNHLYVMRVPSAQGTVDTASLKIFDTFYQMNNYGLAAAESFVLFFLILLLTLFQFRLFGRKVFYG